LSASLGVYTTVLCGLSSGSKFGVLGTFRFIFQLLSFEINFSIVILIIGCYILGFSSMNVLSVYKLHIPLLCYTWFFIYLIMLGMLETARVPFDLPESESELVSGYNTEYSSFLFALLFLGEYGSVFVFAGFIMFVMGGSLSGLVKLVCIVLVSILIIASRCIYPRLRYYTVVSLG
jgi:NADH-quinone oxidoreductase subunit H